MQRVKLNKLADFLDQLPANKFKYSRWFVGFGCKHRMTGREIKATLEHTCGTQACALGWATTLWPQDWRTNVSKFPEPYLSTGEDCFRAAAKFFGVSLLQAMFLFSPVYSDEGHSEEPTDDPKFVANKIRTFIQEHDDGQRKVEQTG